MTACPTATQLSFTDGEIACAMRRRLGMVVNFEGPDAHGHRRLADNLEARLNARHTVMIGAWRQVLSEAGGQIPDRNVERLLSNTHIPVRGGDTRRLDLVVPGLNVARGLPLFCDVTVLSPLSRNGQARAGTSNRGGQLLVDATRENNSTYREVLDSGLGALFCLGCEVYGRWNATCIKLMTDLAREHTRGLHPRVRRGAALSYHRRWWALVGASLQKSVAAAVLRDAGGDLASMELCKAPPLADLPVL